MGFEELQPLTDDAAPHWPLYIDDTAESNKGSGPQERRYFRLGSPGCVSTLHYDEYHVRRLPRRRRRLRRRPRRRRRLPDG